MARDNNYYHYLYTIITMTHSTINNEHDSAKEKNHTYEK